MSEESTQVRLGQRDDLEKKTTIEFSTQEKEKQGLRKSVSGCYREWYKITLIANVA